MHRRTRLESWLVRYTAVFVLIYAPIEVWVSLPRLWDLFFLVDAIGIGLMVTGVGFAREQPTLRSAVLATAYGWMGANVWRGMAMRLEAYDPRLWPEAKIMAIGEPGVAVGGGALVTLCAIGMLMSIEVARRIDAAPRALDVSEQR